MPRKAREKHNEAIYHIMCRSVSEIQLFRDNDDKEQYLKLLKRYADKYRCSVYAYCLMSNHLHIHFDPKGYDISKFMHSLNTSYVRYYNKKYQRHGHVLQERFQSRIVDSDGYNMVLSAYIHNNPKDIEGYADRVEEYEYSSYGIYVGIRKDHHELIEIEFIKDLMGIRSMKDFVRIYSGFVSKSYEEENLDKHSAKDIEERQNEYISGRKTVIRELTPTRVIEYIADKLKQPINNILSLKRKQKHNEFRAFAVYVLRVLCGLGYKQICEVIYNITISGCSRLCDKGFELVSQQSLLYADIFNELLNLKVA